MLFLATGGTIDKIPAYLPDGSFDNGSRLFKDTHLPEMLEKARYSGEHSIEQLCMVDSLDMTDELRELISEAAEATLEEQIIITHGTDTMPETASFLARNKRLARKTIVLTGAMIPYSIGEQSDALFNLGNAVGFVQTLPSGIYVAMNGRTFEANNVRKDVEAGVFKELK